MRIGGYSVPFLSLFLFFAFGILFAEYSPIYLNTSYLAVIFTVFTAIAGFSQIKFHIQKLVFKLALSISLFILGCIAHVYQDNTRNPFYYDITEKVDFTGVVIKRQVGSSVDFNKYYGELEFVHQNGLYKTVTGGVIVYLPKADSSYYYLQDKLLFKTGPAALPEKRNPYEFDYKQYLNRNGIDFQIKGKVGIYKKVGSGSGLRNSIDKLRKSISEKFEKNMEHSGVAKALILGYKNDLSPDTLDAFQKTGSMHVLAVSGLHLGILFVFLELIFKTKLGRVAPKLVQFIFIVTILWIYVFLSGTSISVIRAAIMFSVIQLGSLLGTRGNVINSLFLSAFIVLLIFPGELFQVGFQLSYLAVLGIVVFHKYIDNWFSFPNKVLNYIWSIVAVSISAQLSIGLLSVYYFHNFPVLFPFSNIVVILLATAQLILGFSFVILSGIDLLAKPIAIVLDYLINLELYLLKYLGSIPYSLMSNIYLTLLELFILYGLVLSTSYYFITNKVKGLYAGFLSLFLFGLVSIWSYAKVRTQDKIVLFGTNDICLAYLKKDTAYVYISSRVNEKAVAFYAEPYIRSSGCSTIVFLKEGETYSSNLVKLEKNGLLRFKDKYFLRYRYGLVPNKDITMLVTKYNVQKFIDENQNDAKNAFLLTDKSYSGFKSSTFFYPIHDFKSK